MNSSELSYVIFCLYEHVLRCFSVEEMGVHIRKEGRGVAPGRLQELYKLCWYSLPPLTVHFLSSVCSAQHEYVETKEQCKIGTNSVHSDKCDWPEVSVRC